MSEEKKVKEKIYKKNEFIILLIQFHYFHKVYNESSDTFELAFTSHCVLSEAEALRALNFLY